MINARARAAVVGSFVSDAATTGVHWIYDQSKTAELAAAAGKAGKSIAFHDPPAGPFYKPKVGDLSPWGHELVPLLQTAAISPQRCDAAAFAAASHKYFVDNKSTIPYVNGALREAHAALEAGKTWQAAATDDTQAHGMGKAPMLVALFAGKPELYTKAVEFCSVHQSGKMAADFAVASVKILERIVLGASVQESLTWAAEPGNLPEAATSAVTAALSRKNGDFAAAIKEMGLSCALPGVFSGSILALARTEPSTSFAAVIEENAIAGGDNCSRAIYIGACLAAERGIEAVPQGWKDSTLFYAEAERLLDAVDAATA